MLRTILYCCNYNFYFTDSPIITNFYISQISKYSLICISNNSAATVVTWKRNGNPINIDGVVFDNSQLVINTLHSTYENKLILSVISPGLYTCTVINDFGNATSESVNGIYSIIK